MKIYLIRHGSTQFTQEGRLQGCLDIPLSQEGKKEAGLLARRLSHVFFDGYFCSNLQRAKQTAVILARPRKAIPGVLPFIREYSWGPLEGLNQQELKASYPALASRYKKGLPLAVPGGENPRYIKSRARLLNSFIHNKFQQHPEGKLAVVTHGRFLQVFLLYALGFSLGGARPFILSPASFSILELTSSLTYRLLLLNDTCHLEQHFYQPQQ